MCRSTEQAGEPPFFKRDRDRLRIRSFHILFSLAARIRVPFPNTLTLVYLPRISGTPLEINGSKIRDDMPALVALHRVRSSEAEDGSEAAFMSTDRIRAGEGVSFDVYAGEEKVLRGHFQRGVKWAVDCHCAEAADTGTIGVTAAELRVVTEGGVVMRENVVMKVAQRRRRRRRMRFCSKLQEIPEEGEAGVCERAEEEAEDEEVEMEGSDGWDMMGRSGMDGGDGKVIEELSWAVDVGILVACFGVGLLMSKSSFKRFIKL